MKIYIAGESADIERPEKWIARAREAGFEITLDWTVFVRQEGPKNDEGFTQALQAKYAAMDVKGVLDADAVWVLWPNGCSHGAAFETGVAYCGASAMRDLCEGTTLPLRPHIICSGPKVMKSIFTALIAEEGYGKRFESDESAFKYLLTLNEA